MYGDGGFISCGGVTTTDYIDKRCRYCLSLCVCVTLFIGFLSRRIISFVVVLFLGFSPRFYPPQKVHDFSCRVWSRESGSWTELANGEMLHGHILGAGVMLPRRGIELYVFGGRDVVVAATGTGTRHAERIKLARGANARYYM